MDRKNIKWAPFNSVVSGQTIINELIEKRNKIKKPILMPEKTQDIENLIKDAFYNKKVVTLQYFNNGYTYNENGLIKEINQNKKTVKLNNTILYFNQIIDIF